MSDSFFTSVTAVIPYNSLESKRKRKGNEKKGREEKEKERKLVP
jgi:hypothetical protein